MHMQSCVQPLLDNGTVAERIDVSALTPIRTPSRLERSGEIALDILIVAVLIYALPLLGGLGVVLVRFLTR
jgi:hypothetical protein